MDEPITIRLSGVLAEYVPEYLAETRRQLDAALAAGGLPALQTLGHNLRGSGASFGLDAIGVIGRDLERSAVRGDHPAALACAAALDAYLRRLVILP